MLVVCLQIVEKYW